MTEPSDSAAQLLGLLAENDREVYRTQDPKVWGVTSLQSRRFTAATVEGLIAAKKLVPVSPNIPGRFRLA